MAKTKLNEAEKTALELTIPAASADRGAAARIR